MMVCLCAFSYFLARDRAADVRRSCWLVDVSPNDQQETKGSVLLKAYPVQIRVHPGERRYTDSLNRKFQRSGTLVFGQDKL